MCLIKLRRVSRVATLVLTALGCILFLGGHSVAQSPRLVGTTYDRAQVLDWLGHTEFAVGRWDGSLSIFRIPNAGEFGPVIVQAMSAPSGHGIEMVVALDELTMVSSDGPGQLSVWKRNSVTDQFVLADTLTYDSKFGTSESAASTAVNGTQYLLTGQEDGHLLIWRKGSAHLFEVVAAVDLNSPNPIPSPLHLRNIRAVVPWRGDVVVTGSEDGDIVGVKLPTGSETFRVRYNQKAQRGINNLSIVGDWLLLSNCSVGASDKNVWLYDLSSGSPVLADAQNLVLDSQRSQVFNFDAILVDGGAGPAFFSSTEEGLLWRGKIDSNRLVVTGVTKVATDGGAILRWDSKANLIAAVAYEIWLFGSN